MNVNGMEIREGEPDPPDVAGPGTVECPCGFFKIRATTLSIGVGLQAVCPHCGTRIESWVTK